MLLLLMTLAHAGTLRATLEWQDGELHWVRGTHLQGDPLRSDPGQIRILDGAGDVIATTSLPPLARSRAVVTPEGHDVALEPQRYVRVDLPWPVEAAAVDLGGSVVRPPADLAPPPPNPPVAVWSSGDPNHRLDLLVLAEGYPAGSEARFEADLDAVLQEFGSAEPIERYADLINVWSAFTPSVDEGLDRTESDDRLDTPYECYRGCSGISRLICCDENLILSDVADVAPFADGVLLLVNDGAYGGSGGQVYATAYTGDQSAQVATHELSHTLFLLWDEYVYPSLEPEGSYTSPNCAPPDVPVPWAHWEAADPDVGSFAGCSFSSWVRPTAGGCMMQSLGDSWCPVCREHIVHEVYRGLLGEVLVDVEPSGAVTIPAGETATFAVEHVGPADARITWRVDGRVVATDVLEYTHPACTPARNVSVGYADETPWVLSDPGELLKANAIWWLDVEPCDTGVVPEPSPEPTVAPTPEPTVTPETEPEGCGCAQGGWTPAWGLLLLGLRRRRS